MFVDWFRKKTVPAKKQLTEAEKSRRAFFGPAIAAPMVVRGLLTDPNPGIAIREANLPLNLATHPNAIAIGFGTSISSIYYTASIAIARTDV